MSSFFFLHIHLFFVVCQLICIRAFFLVRVFGNQIYKYIILYLWKAFIWVWINNKKIDIYWGQTQYDSTKREKKINYSICNDLLMFICALTKMRIIFWVKISIYASIFFLFLRNFNVFCNDFVFVTVHSIRLYFFVFCLFESFKYFHLEMLGFFFLCEKFVCVCVCFRSFVATH